MPTITKWALQTWLQVCFFKCEPKQWFLLIYQMNLGLIRAN